MATIELLPEEIFSEENEYLKIPDSVLDELKKYAPKNFNSLSSDNEKSLQLKNEGLEVLFNIFSRSCMISASFTDPEMSDVFVKETKEIKKIEDVFFGIEYIVFHISEKRIEKIFLEIGSVGLSDKEFNNCLINLYESYEKNRKKTLKMLKNVFNLLTYFNKKNVFEEKKRNPNVINFIKGNPEENVIIDEFIFEDYKLKVNYNLKDIRSNTLLIEYTGKKYPIVNNIKVLGIDFKKDKDNFIISKIRGKYGGLNS